MPYIGKSTDGFGIRERFTYVVSAGATSISGADANGRTLAFEDPEYVDVFLNGVRLKKDTDFNLNTANTISSLSALVADDEVEVIVNDVFTLADMVSANTGGDFRGSIAIQKDSGVLSFGADKEITLTHVADTGLLLNGTSQLQFNDASQNITAPSATVLDINATDEVELNATLIDINGNVEISGTTAQVGVSTSTAKDIFNAGMSVKNGSSSAGFVEFFENSGNGTNKVTLIGPASTADVTLTLGSTTGTVATTDDVAGEATALAIALG